MISPTSCFAQVLSLINRHVSIFTTLGPPFFTTLPPGSIPPPDRVPIITPTDQFTMVSVISSTER